MDIRIRTREDGGADVVALNPRDEQRIAASLEPGQELTIGVPGIGNEDGFVFNEVITTGAAEPAGDGEAAAETETGGEEPEGDPATETASQKPDEVKAPSGVGIGRAVTYRSRTGDYDVPAVICATVDTLNPAGVESGNVPPLSAPDCVHLTVFTPGKEDTGTDDPAIRTSPNRGGSYQEWDIPQFETPERGAEDTPLEPGPGTWRWPERV